MDKLRVIEADTTMHKHNHEIAMRNFQREQMHAAATTIQIRHLSMIAKACLYFCLGAASLIYSVRANARELAYVANRAGGEIILTDEKSDRCPEGTLVIISKTADGTQFFGCWAGRYPYVYAKWDDGAVSMFKIEDFELVAQAHQGFGT